MRSPTFTLLLLLASTTVPLVSAQWGDYLKNVLSGQAPLLNFEPPLSREQVIEKNTHNITSENWRSSVNNTSDFLEIVDGEEVEAMEWYFYFTSSNVNGTQNATFWDGVFNDTVYALVKSDIKLGNIDCSSPAATVLCNSFFLTLNEKLPVLYHIASYPTNIVEIRQVQWNRNITDAEQSEYLAKFHREGLWKSDDINPWRGVLNPIDGALKDVAPWLGILLGYYEKLPQWVALVMISLVGRQMTSRVTGRRNLGRPETATRAHAPIS